MPRDHAAQPTAAGAAPGPRGRTPERSGGPLRIGIGGPVGSGKTALVAALCRSLRDELSVAVVTNDIHSREDAEILLRQGALEPDRIAAVETGCCPHAAIRDDISANLEAVEGLESRLDPLDLVLIESGGGTLSATFSRGLIDRQMFVIDVAGGDRAPRKGGPGIAFSDLLVVNKTDLARLVRADLELMRRDAAAKRGERPTAFISLAEHPDAPAVADWIRMLIAQRRAVLQDAGAGAEAGAAGP